MEKARLYRTGKLLLVLLGCLWLAPQVTAYVMLRQPWVLARLEDALRGDLVRPYGLAVEFSHLKAGPGLGLEIPGLRLRDLRQKRSPAVIRVAHVYARFSLFRLLLNLKHPEAAVVEILMDRPEIEFSRAADGSWLWQRFMRAERSKNYFRPVIGLHAAKVVFHDSPTIRPLGVVTLPDARFDLRAYPAIRGWATILTGLDPGLRLSVTARYNLDDGEGWARLAWRGAAPALWQASGWIPAERARVLGGKLDGEAEIVLGKSLGVRQASVKLTEGRVQIVRAGLPVVSISGQAGLRRRVLDLTNLRVTLGHGSLRGDLRLDIAEIKNPSISGTVRIGGVELGELSSLLPLPAETKARGRVQGWVAISGRWPRPILRGEYSLADGEFSSPSLPSFMKIRATGRLAAQTLHITTLLGEAGGIKVAGRGQMRLLPSPRLDLTLETGKGSIGGVLGELGAPGWRGKADVRTRVTAVPGRIAMEADLKWYDLSWQGRSLPDGGAEVNCEAEGADVRFMAFCQAGSGRLKAQGRLARGEWQGSARLDRVRLAPLAQLLPPAAGGIDGEASGNLLWHGPVAWPEVKLAGHVTNLSVAGRRFDALQGSFSWRGSEITVDACQVTAGEASASMRGRVDWRRNDLALNLALHGLPLAIFQPGMPGRIEGQVDLSGGWPKEITGRGWAHLSGLAWQGVPLGVAELEADLAGGTVNIRRGHLESADGRLDMTGAIQLAGGNALALAVTDLDWAASAWNALLPGRAGLRGRLTGTGRITGTLDAPLAEVSLAMGPGEAFDLEWRSVVADLRWQERLIVERAVLTGLGMEIAVNGSLGPEDGWDLGLMVREADLAAVADAIPYEIPVPLGRVGGLARLEGRIKGPLGQPVLEGELQLVDPVFGSFSCERMDGRFNLERGVLSLAALEAWSGSRKYAAHGRIDLRRGTAEAVLGVVRGDLAGMLGLASIHLPWPLQGVVTGTARVSGSLSRPTWRSELRLEEGSLGKVAVAGELDLSSDGLSTTVNRLSLALGEGTLHATGRLSADEFMVNLEGKALPLSDLAKLAGYREEVRGRGDLRLFLDRAGRSMHGVFSVEIGQGAAWAQIPLDRVVAEGEIKDRNIWLNQAQLISGKHSLTASGRFPFPGDLGPLETLIGGVPGGQDRLALKVEGTELPAPLFNPALRGVVSFTGGSLSLAAKVAGTWAKPAMDGTITLAGASGRTPYLPDPFSDLSADVRLDRQSFIINEAGARIGAGSAKASGRVSVMPDGLHYDLSLRANRIAYKDPAFFDGQISTADLLVAGGPIPFVTGSITASDTRITAGIAPPGTPPPPIGFDIRLVAAKDVRFFLPGVADVPVSGELQLRGTMLAPTLSGVINITRGAVFVYGERFEITGGVATFTVDRGYLPHVEVQGVKVIRGVKIFVTARGEITEAGLAINLRSDPPLTQQEILGLLRWSSSPDGSEAGPSPVTFFVGGLELVVDTVFGQLSEDFRRLIDADQLQLGLDDRSGAFSLQMGKFVRDDLYVSYKAELFEFGQRVWSFDYHLNPFLVLSGVFSTTEDPKWGLSYQIRF